MNLYEIVTFGHALGMLGLAKVARSREEALTWIRATGITPPMAVASLAVVVLTGCYLAANSAAWSAGWMRVSLGTAVLIGLLGGIGGRRVREFRRAGANADLKGLTADPRIQLPIRLRASLAAGIIFLMVARPSLVASIEVAVAAIVLGIAWSVPAFLRTARG